jgi:hypothetical protein
MVYAKVDHRKDHEQIFENFREMYPPICKEHELDDTFKVKYCYVDFQTFLF